MDPARLPRIDPGHTGSVAPLIDQHIETFLLRAFLGRVCLACLCWFVLHSNCIQLLTTTQSGLGLCSQTVGFVHSHPSPVSSDAPVDIDTEEGTPVKSSR